MMMISCIKNEPKDGRKINYKQSVKVRRFRRQQKE
jgi:hypothetical protein